MIEEYQRYKHLMTVILKKQNARDKVFKGDNNAQLQN